MYAKKQMSKASEWVKTIGDRPKFIQAGVVMCLSDTGQLEIRDTDGLNHLVLPDYAIPMLIDWMRDTFEDKEKINEYLATLLDY